MSVALARVGPHLLAIDTNRVVDIRDGWPPADSETVPLPWHPRSDAAADPSGETGRTLVVSSKGTVRLLAVDAVAFTEVDLDHLHAPPSFLAPAMHGAALMGLLIDPGGLAFLLDVDLLCDTAAGRSEMSR